MSSDSSGASQRFASKLAKMCSNDADHPSQQSQHNTSIRIYQSTSYLNSRNYLVFSGIMTSFTSIFRSASSPRHQVPPLSCMVHCLSYSPNSKLFRRISQRVTKLAVNPMQSVMVCRRTASTYQTTPLLPNNKNRPVLLA